jgi:dTDP-4-amino-4,6-dideoxygalactose transaminase
MIPFVDLTREDAEMGMILDKAIRRVRNSGRYILNGEVKAFEVEFARYIGADYAVGVNSGSDALFLAIQGLGIKPGDEVITVSHTFASTVDAIVRNGATPVFVDIDPETYCMDPDAVVHSITQRTRGIIPVHLYGHPVDLDPIRELVTDHQIVMVEDACQAHGSRYHGRTVGGLSEAGCFSFYPTKNLGSWGDGGCVVTNDHALAERIRMLRNYGQINKYDHRCVGINSRLDEMQAAILREKLVHLDEWNDRRHAAAREYQDALEGFELILPVEKTFAYHVYHLYVVRSSRRDRLAAALTGSGIQTGIHYPIPIHQQYAYRKYGNTLLPMTEQVAGEILSLPMHPWITLEEIYEVTRKVIGCLP